MKVTTLHELFLLGLTHIVSVENQIIEALPKMADKASSEALKNALTDHLNESKQQHQTVLDLCKEMSVDTTTLDEDLGIKGIIQKGEKLLDANESSPVLDLAIIEAAQKVEHYEIACYGTLANYAQEMGHQDAQDLLHRVMQEEKTTDEELTKLAEVLIPQAPSGM